MKKILALVLALALLSSCAVAMADLDPSKVVDNPAEKISIVWLAGHDTDPISDDDPILKWLEETFNVDLDVWMLERGDTYDQLLSQRVIGDDIPDVFLLENAAQFAKYIKQDVLMELPMEVVKSNLPNSYAWLMEYDPSCFENVSFNGKNYGLPRVNLDGYYNYAPFWRKDWLEKYGYTDGKVPMTVAECEEVFYKFANEDPDGNGVKDTYALSNTGFNPIFGAYGALPDRWVDDGEGNLVYGAVYPGMKDALAKLAQWYADGLIDPEFVTGENQGGHWCLSVPFENGVIGFSSSAAFYQLEPDFDGPDSDKFKQVGKAMRTFASKYGYENMIIGYNPVGPDGTTQGGESWGLTTSEAIVFSYKLEDEPAKLARILKIIETIGSDYDSWWKIWRWDLDMDHYDYDKLTGYGIKEGFEKPAENHGNMFNTLQNPNFRKIYDPARYSWGDSMPMFHTGGYSNVKLAITTASQPDFWDSLETMRMAAYVGIIKGDQPVDSFDAFVDNWYAAGGSKITEEANEWYHSR